MRCCRRLLLQLHRGLLKLLLSLWRNGNSMRKYSLKSSSIQHANNDSSISLAQVLLTALPLSLRLIAATNVPAVSSILWEEFLDDKKPDWFLDLPWDIQSYLITEFGPQTAWPTAPPTTETSDSEATPTASDVPTETNSGSESLTASISGSESFNSASTPTNSASESSASSSSSTSASRSSTASASNSSLRPLATAATDPEAPASSSSGLTRGQKIGIGLGVPLALLAIAALLFCCCLLCRRRKKRRVNGTEPPSSPGFIPRFSFQDRGLSYEHHEHRAPLTSGYHETNREISDGNWDDDDYEHAAIAASHRRDTFPPAASTAAAPMAMQDTTPIMAPALFHSHSSNRARGKRTSYTSLHAVAEVAEPDESPILGRRQSPPKTGPRRPSLPTIVDMPAALAAGSIKRKPVPTSPTGANPAADQASQSLLRPALARNIPDHRGSSSSGLALSSASSHSGYQTDSPISPITAQQPPVNPFADRFEAHHASTNPFAGGYEYLEDYGPEYSNDGYLEHSDNLYGGRRSLDRYPEPAPPRQSSKTEWPLRNMVGSPHRRDSSPMWDRVYESR